MTNYSIKTVKNNHKIVEKATGHVVFESKNKRKAHKRLTFYNMGGAFDGWTPSFFLIECPVFPYSEVE